MLELYAVVTGVVQGVHYRDFVQSSATELGLVGMVRHGDHGTIELRAQGDLEILKQFVEYLHEGSVLSTVTGVAVEWCTPSSTYHEFSILMDEV